MKRFFTLLLCITFVMELGAREFEVRGPQGSLAMTVTLPKGFDKKTDKCPMVILMHGIFSSHNIVPMSCSDEYMEAYAATFFEQLFGAGR